MLSLLRRLLPERRYLVFVRGSLLVTTRVAVLLLGLRRAATLLAPFGSPGLPRAGARRGSLAGALRGPLVELRLPLLSGDLAMTLLLFSKNRQMVAEFHIPGRSVQRLDRKRR